MKVSEGEILFTIYSNSKEKLGFALNTFNDIAI